jgi:hypothetical protein
MHAAGRRRPGTWIRPAGPHPPAALQPAGGGRARSAAEDGERSRTSASRRGVRAPPAPIDHPLRVAAVNWLPAAAPAAAALALVPALFGSGGHGESSRG